MRYSLRQIEENAKFTDEVRLDALEKAIPYETIQQVVQDHGVQRQRKRKFSAELSILLFIAMHLFQPFSLAQVLHSLLVGLRLIWPGVPILSASKGAISQQRYALGVRPLVDLFHRVCKPVTQPDTPGAFLFGLRLMAIDGTIETVPDTPENERAFGRHHTQKGEAAFPQLLAIYLLEIGSHAIVDAGFWPLHTGERHGAYRLMRSVQAGMLVFWDIGFHSYKLVHQVLARRAHFVGRISTQMKPKLECVLPDGSQLVWLLTPRWEPGLPRRILVRLIEYTVTDPALPGYGERHRLITSLLDPQRYPALEIACSYHERWEIEITIDETDTHQRLAERLRSRKPVGVLQELYGLLLAHYAVRTVMLQAADLVAIDPDRISFTNALRLIGKQVIVFQLFAPEQQEALYQQLLSEVARYRLPPRKARINPRVVKQMTSHFPRKRPEHYHTPQPSSPFKEAIQILI